MKTLIIDTETNGAEKPEVIELAYRDVTATQMFLARYKPSVPSNYGALATHHILPEELEGLPPSSRAVLPPCDYVIGHKVDYDWEVLGKPPVKRICTLAIARALYPECDSHKLGAMYYRLFGAFEATREDLRNAHSAAADVNMCFELLLAMLADRAPDKSVARPEELWDFSEDCRLPRVITFGKHKGTALIDLPGGYVTWCKNQADMDPYFIKALQKFRGGR